MGGSNSKSIVVIAGAAGVGMLLTMMIFYQAFWVPYRALGQELATAEEELSKKDKELREFEVKKKKLQRARIASFPVPTKNWLTGYETYLRRLPAGFQGNPDHGPDHRGGGQGGAVRQEGSARADHPHLERTGQGQMGRRCRHAGQLSAHSAHAPHQDHPRRTAVGDLR